MSHPQNERHPEPLRIWGDWTEGSFLNFCPIKREAKRINPGENYIQKFRVFIKSDSLSPGRAEELWQAFANLPSVRFLAI